MARIVAERTVHAHSDEHEAEALARQHGGDGEPESAELPAYVRRVVECLGDCRGMREDGL